MPNPSDTPFGWLGEQHPEQQDSGSGDQPPPPDVNIPTLEIDKSKNWPPPLTGELPPAPPPDEDFWKEGPPPTVTDYHILPSSIRDAERTIMTSLTTAVQDWHDLKAYVERVKPWVFYKPESTSDDKHFPPSEDALNLVKYLDNVLLMAADAITITGKFVNRLNAAGQIYVHADKESVFPAD